MVKEVEKSKLDDAFSSVQFSSVFSFSKGASCGDEKSERYFKQLLWKVVWSVVAIAVVSFPFVGERKKASKQAGRNEVAVPLCHCAFWLKDGRIFKEELTSWEILELSSRGTRAYTTKCRMMRSSNLFLDKCDMAGVQAVWLFVDYWKNTFLLQHMKWNV